LPTEVVMHCGHRIPYDRAVELAGGGIVQIGNAIQTFDWELEAVLGTNTAMVLWVAGSHLSPGTLDLADTVRIAHARGIPVVVDAAAQLPPVENLWAFTQAGADLALFSGGKALRGPQATGLVLGTATMIEAVRANGAPHQRLARAMKVGKEEMLGLLAAVRRYLALDHPAQQAAWEAAVARWSAELNSLPGVTAARAYPNEAGQPSPRLHVCVDAARTGVTAAEVVRHLWQRNPRIAVGVDGEHGFFMTPDTLAPGEDYKVLDAIRAQLGRTGRPARKPAQ
jgi:L-seryl-tRNA(Ser) seleniumtransferase